MATYTTPLLSDFDFDLTSSTNTLQNLSLLDRPPTPDPRFSNNHQRKPRELYKRPESLAVVAKGVRRRPTTIHIASPSSRPDAAQPWSGNAVDRNFPHSELTTLDPQKLSTKLSPLLPSTPPTFLPALSPSLSSCGTLQSSPTLTPTSPFQNLHDLQREETGDFGGSNESHHYSKYGLRRAKRLPRSDHQKLWEVHAIVHVSPTSGGGGGEQQAQHKQHPVNAQSFAFTEQIPTTPNDLTRLTTAESTALAKQESFLLTTPSQPPARVVRFQGVNSESASREDSLRRLQKEESSLYSLSKFQFPAPPGHYLVGERGKCVT
jgi:hypothetical protein